VVIEAARLVLDVAAAAVCVNRFYIIEAEGGKYPKSQSNSGLEENVGNSRQRYIYTTYRLLVVAPICDLL
jgi:hypothetical protein